MSAPSPTERPRSTTPTALGGLRPFMRPYRLQIGLAILLSLAVVAILAPVIAPVGPNDQDLTRRLLAPSGAHWFGTDAIGRDMLTRMIYGGQTTIFVATAATALSFVGTIGFVGLVGPHIARMLIGEDQRFFLPASVMTGALLLSISSVVSKTLIPGAIFPIGVVTSLIGVPFFISLILGRRERSW